MREPTVLAFDTSAAHCAAALLCGDQIHSVRVEEMARGQAERLMGLLEEMLADARLEWSDLSRIGVGVGPGNFTGIRISVAAARGLALGLGIPAIGVSTLQAIHDAHPTANAAVQAPRDHLYVQAPGEPPAMVARDTAGPVAFIADTETLVSTIARISAASHSTDRPKPLYIKPADAAPARNQAPKILI